MKLQEIYQKVVELGMKADPRGEAEVNRKLAEVRQKFADLKPDEQAEFDQEQLTNPYSDSRILFGAPELEVKTVLVEIDVDTGELVMVDRLRTTGTAIDLVITHHPEGGALAALHGVMELQSDTLHAQGVPINVAEAIMSPRINEVRRNLMPINHQKTVDAARLLEIPLMCVHTPADNQVNTYLEQLFAREQPRTLQSIVKLLKQIPEYKAAVKNNAGPQIIVGQEKARTGKIFVDMTGGTSGPEEAYEKMAIAGVGTVVCMHVNDKHRKLAEKYHINVIVAGHMASDSLGLNLLMDELEQQGLTIIAAGGYTRYQRLGTA